LLAISNSTIRHDLHFAAKIPKDGSEEESNDGSEKEPNGIVRRVPPV
jgi:hypothetical protein